MHSQKQLDDKERNSELKLPSNIVQSGESISAVSSRRRFFGRTGEDKNMSVIYSKNFTPRFFKKGDEESLIENINNRKIARNTLKLSW